ncbi:MAG: Type IV secretion system pilin [uncultured Clostridium sp.]
MDNVLNIAKTLIQAFQLGGGVLFVFCLLKAGYKAMWSKQKRDEIKDDLAWAVVGLVLIVGCFALGEYVQSLISF